MKIFFSCCDLKSYFYDEGVKFGIGWYKHHKGHKWKGFTFQLYLYFWLVCINYVNNWAEYDKKINYRKYKKDKSTL